MATGGKWGTGVGGKQSVGAFHSMGLPATLLHALRKLNYKQPTPIQRKALPPLLLGLDVVGMARTGSGKTAAFAVPMIVRLRGHEAVVGVRGLVVSPTRELAVQTGKAITMLCKGTDLRVGQIVGGESLEAQFAVLAQNPDILVVTPGRLLHLAQVETRLGLTRVQMVVFDEADRLFEMGFQEQLKELLSLLPPTRQTCMFSATLPSSLADFAAAGLRPDAQFIRLDVEMKVSPDLQCEFYRIRSEYRVPALMLILNRIYSPPSHLLAAKKGAKRADPLTIVFTATRHHVDYLQELLVASGYQAAGVYGAMDQEARTEALQSFRAGTKPILVVTDLAARGLDIPMLDYVVNVDMPPTGKLFIHRVGRAARAGRTGTAYTVCSVDELPYYVDLARHLNLVPSDHLKVFEQHALDTISAQVAAMHDHSAALPALHRVMTNATKQYVASRPTASNDAYTLAKQLPVCDTADDLLTALHNYKPACSLLNRNSNSKEASGKNSDKNSGKNSDKNSGKNSDDYYMSYTPKNDTASEDKLYSIHSQLWSAADRQHATEHDRLTRPPSANPAAAKKYRDDGKYDQWRKKTHVSLPRVGEPELDQQTRAALSARRKRFR